MTKPDQAATAIGDATANGLAGDFESLLGDTSDTSGEETPEAGSEGDPDNETEPEGGAEPTEGEEDAEEVAEEEGEEAEPAAKYTVKVDGQEQDVTLDELLNGYQLKADYTRKTQKVAEDRRALEAESNAVKQERARYAEVLEGLEAQLSAGATEEPNWDELRASDPIEFAAQWAQHQRVQARQNQVAAERQRVAGLQAQEQARLFQAHVVSEQGKLLDAIPEWKDAEKAAAGKKALVAYGISIGFTPEELGGVVDHRAVLALYNAQRFAALQTRKPQVQAQIAKSKVLKPGTVQSGSRQSTDFSNAGKRLAQSGRVKDAAAMFEQMLG